jgi:hypothetical protein
VSAIMNLRDLGESVRVRYVSILKKRTEMVLETLVFSSLNQLTWLVAREYFIVSYQYFFKPISHVVCLHDPLM